MVSETPSGRVLFDAPLPGLLADSAVGNLLGFHGLSHDPETGFVYARHRYYDPELGRFITADPMGYEDGPNLYQYALGNPVDLSDPMGLSSDLAYPLWQAEHPGQLYRLGHSVDPGTSRDFRRAAYSIAGTAALFSGPVGWVGFAGLVATQAEARYEQLVELEDRPGDDLIWQAGYLGATDMLAIGAAQELWTGQDRVTGATLGDWARTARVLELVPVAVQSVRGLKKASAAFSATRSSSAAVPRGTTPLYRAVSQAELDDLAAHSGAFRNPPGAEVKYFSTEAQGAASYARQTYQRGGLLYEGPYSIVETRIPTSSITPEMVPPFGVDRGISTVVVPTEQLPLLSPARPLNYTPLPPR